MPIPAAWLLVAKWVAFVITVVATIQQRVRQRKMEKAMAEQADKQKGFQLVAEGEVQPINVYYGRNKVGGTRVFHRVGKRYIYAAPNAGGVAFTTKGNPNGQFMDFTNDVQVSNLSMYLPANIDGNGSVEKTINVPLDVRADLDVNSLRIIIPNTTAGNQLVSAMRPGNENSAGWLRVKHKTIVFAHWGSLEIGEMNVREMEINYRILNYNPNTREVELLQSQTARTLYDEGMRTYVADSKNEFLYIQQVIGYRGINKVYNIEIDGQDFRTPSFGDSGRIHVYTEGGVSDNMMYNNNLDRAKAWFGNAAYASMVFRLNRDEPQYQGIPQVQFHIEGMKIRKIIPDAASPVGYSLSPDKVYSNSPALCLLDYLMNTEYGRGLSINEVDLPSFYRADQVCSMVVPVNGNYTMPISGYLWQEKSREAARYINLYECNLGIDTSQSVRDNIDVILETMGKAELVWSNGQYKLQLEYPLEYGVQHTEFRTINGEVRRVIVDGPGTYNKDDVVQYPAGAASNVDLYRCGYDNTPMTNSPNAGQSTPTWYRNVIAAYLTDDDILTDEDITQTWPTTQDRLNFYTVRFLNESHNFAEDSVSWPPKNGNNAVYLQYMKEDNNQKLEGETFQTGDTTYQHAMATAEERVRSSRSQVVYKFPVSIKNTHIEPNDFIKVTSSVLNINGELMQVEEISVEDEQRAIVQAVKFDARNMAWNAKDDQIVDQRNIYLTSLGQATNLMFNPASALDTMSLGQLSWTKASDTRVARYIIKVTETPFMLIDENTVWMDVGSSDSGTFDLPFLKKNSYTATVVAVGHDGRQAPFQDIISHTTWPLIRLAVPENTLNMSTVSLTIFTRSATLPTAPVGGQFNFLDSTLNSLPAGWEVSPPLGTDPVYAATAIVAVRYPESLSAPIQWGNPKFYFSNGEARYTLTAYTRGVPTVTPTGGSFTFPRGTAQYPLGVPPTSTDGTIWSTEFPAGDTAVYVSYALATGPNDGINTNQLVWSAPVVQIKPDDFQGEMYLYRWSTSLPTITGGKIRRTWTTGADTIVTAITGSAGGTWTLTVPAPSGNSQLYLYRMKKRVTAPAGTATTDITLGSSETIEQISAAGAPGTRSASAKMYQWALNTPTIVSTNATYNWTTGVVSAYPTGWFATPQGAPSPGFSLYEAEIKLIDVPVIGTALAATSALTWSSANSPPRIIGYAAMDGAQGVKGNDGTSFWTWIKYSPNADGTGLTDVPDINTAYIGIAANQIYPTESENPADYVWTRFKGADGVGTKGADGVTKYTWIKYASTSSGGSLSDLPAGKTYIGIATNKDTAVESTVASDYTWSLIQGPQGAKGADGTSTFVFIRYSASADGSNFTEYPDGTSAYIGIQRSVTSIAGTVNTDYTWSKFKGDDGVGIKGADGVTKYTWIKYATNSVGAGLTDSPTNMPYIGLAHNKDTATESTVASDYTWSLIRGSDGVTPPSAILTNESVTLPANYLGAVASYSGATCSMKVFLGAADDTSNWSIVPSPASAIGALEYTYASGVLTVTKVPNNVDSYAVTFTATKSGQTITKTFNINKSKSGQDGSTAKIVHVVASEYVFKTDKLGGTLPATITFTASGSNLTGSPSFSATSGTTLTGTTGNTRTLSLTNMTTDSATITVTWDGQTDTVTVIKVREGVDGATNYTWIKYADNASGLNMSDSPTGKIYMGIALNKTTATKSTVAGDYTWSLIQGPQGGQGIQGPIGPNGNPTYTWIKYATSAAGAGLNDSPTGMTYMGIAYNKTTATESTVATDYEWSLIQGPQGIQGPKGDTGNTGATGSQGASIRTAYAKSTLGALSQTAISPTTGSTSFPAANSFGGSETWVANPPALAAGEYCHQIDGIYNPTTNQTTWTTPYQMALKVGSLSAIVVNTGALNISGTLSSANGNFSVTSTGVTTIRSGTTGARLVLTNDKIQIYDATTLRVKIGNLA